MTRYRIGLEIDEHITVYRIVRATSPGTALDEAIADQWKWNAPVTERAIRFTVQPC